MPALVFGALAVETGIWFTHSIKELAFVGNQVPTSSSPEMIVEAVIPLPYLCRVETDLT